MPHDDDRPTPALDRRTLLRHLGVGVVTVGTGVLAPPALHAKPAGRKRTPALMRENRVRRAYAYRRRMARDAARRPVFRNRPNGDEDAVPHRAACYTKALPHDALGHVVPEAYDALAAACRSGRSADFDRVPLGLGRRLTSAQAGLAFDLEGCDSHHTALPAPPAFSSAEIAAEMVELYWMAHCRDVPFTAWETDPRCAAAAAELSALPAYRGVRAGGAVTPAVLFRGGEPGATVGPYVSQFLWRDVPWGAQLLSQRSSTGAAGVDWMTRWDEWLAVQNGRDPRGTDALDLTYRWISNLRGLARWVQIDALYQAYLNAALILLGLGAPFAPGIPSVGSRTCEGFVDWGAPHLLALVCEVSSRALKAVWYHKWLVHRRLRPEEFGGRVHAHLTGRFTYPIHESVLGSAAVAAAYARHGTFLLPMAYPEGSPTHPSYGSGHATVAGACTTILKAWFDEDWVLPKPVAADADGTALVPYEGPPLTVGGELNKLAANVAIGRNAAGVHWRSDYRESLRLGEYVAKCILEEQKPSYNQAPELRFTSFDGEPVTL